MRRRTRAGATGGKGRTRSRGRQAFKSDLNDVPAFDAGTTRHRTVKATGTAQVTCWCDRSVVEVPLDDVAAGRTRSCGKPTCNLIAELEEPT